MSQRKIFEPNKIGHVEFKNRLIRSSIGGRMAYYNGEVNEAWQRFERRFAEGGVGGIISATMTVHPARWSPLEYPRISDDRFIDRLQVGVRGVRERGCRYILQLGDPGYQTQTSLLSERADEMGPSRGFDFLYGYRNRRSEMPPEEIDATIENFRNAALRVKEIGCDGIEITASKGYLIHQFLNPAINRRKDHYGGSLTNRFRLLEQIILAVREAVGRDFLLGVRLSAQDYNESPPLNIRLPRSSKRGNKLPDYLAVAKWLRDLKDREGTNQGIDYVHISNGYGFPNPRETPGKYPADMVRQFFSSTSHLSLKAGIRSVLAKFPAVIVGAGWNKAPGVNLEEACAFKKALGDFPVIVNGGFQERALIEKALQECDLVSMARPLLANSRLPEMLERGEDGPANPCTFCNRCTVATTIYPVGCYDESRFGGDRKLMQEEIERWNRPDSVAALVAAPASH